MCLCVLREKLCGLCVKMKVNAEIAEKDAEFAEKPMRLLCHHS